jgi:hypothetical protein
MLTAKHHIFWVLTVVLFWTLQSLPAFSQTIADRAQTRQPDRFSGGQKGSDLIPALYKATEQPGRTFVPATWHGTFTPEMVSIPPDPVQAAPTAQIEKLMITQISGDVRIKHQQGQGSDSERAMVIETGRGVSWCECKLSDFTGRVASDSQVSVFPDTGVLNLEKGALVVKARKGAGDKYTVVAGDFVCRVQASVIRVQRHEKSVDFQVLDGTLTVSNRITGESFTARQVNQPIR